jgi:hypothetical protein
MTLLPLSSEIVSNPTDLEHRSCPLHPAIEKIFPGAVDVTLDRLEDKADFVTPL